MMPEISLTDFVDFVVRSGTPKLTKVSQIKRRGKYDPATDFWRPLREEIIKYHREGGGNKRQLDKVMSKLTDQKKINRYPTVIKGYKRFLGNKKMTWFDPPRGIWSNTKLDVRVNPEIGLNIKSTRHIIKLYFKNEKLSQRRADVVLGMMEQALHKKLKPSDQIAVLDIPRNGLCLLKSKHVNLAPLLIGEAASFVAMWDQIK